MADKKISALTGATTPLAGTEVLPIVQGGSTVKVSVDNLTAGKSVSASAFVPTGSTVPANGMYLDTTNSVSIANNSAKTATIRAGGIMGLGTTPQSWYLPGDIISAQQIGANTVTMSLFGNQSHFGSNFYLKTGTGNDTYINTGVAMRYRQDGGSHVFESAPSGTANTNITFTPLATVAANGNFTVHTNNLVVGTAGKGIDFSANTHAAGMTSELLNWYEEGTWTATISDGTTDATMNAGRRTGTYTRVGRQVTVHMYVATTSMTGVTGNLRVKGLPFTVGSSPTVGGSIGYCDQMTFIAGQVMVLQTASGVDYIVLRYWNGGTTPNMVGAQWGAIGEIGFTLTYFV
jgi:hypothetical protein